MNKQEDTINDDDRLSERINNLIIDQKNAIQLDVSKMSKFLSEFKEQVDNLKNKIDDIDLVKT